MGLLMSDTLLFDPALHETLRLLDSISELAYANVATRDFPEDEDTDLPM